MLLQKAKVITTPTAYSDGILHSVKPNVLENLLLQSNQFDTTWVNARLTTLSDGQIGYDGSNDAWSVVPNTANDDHKIYQSVSQTGVITFSVYAKANGYNGLALVSSNTNNGKFFNLSNGTLGNNFNSSPIDASITEISNGWYRCEVVFNVSAGNFFTIYVSSDGTSTYSFSGNGTDGILIQDAQLNKGYSADQYIETTTETSPRADFTFTRNSSATRLGEDGYIQDVALDLPRINYEGFSYENGLPIYGSGKGHLLLEGQSTNNLPYSENFATNWTKYLSTITTDNSTLSPDGETNGTLVSKNGQPYARIEKGSLALASNTYTFSVFAKKGLTNWIQLRIDGTAVRTSSFDLENGVVGTNSGVTSANIEDYGNGWYRCSISFTDSVTICRLYVADVDNGWGNTNAASAYFWGAMLEENSYATSYIPTNGSAVTRAAETCNNAGYADLFDSEGVLYAEIAALANDGTNRMISISDDTNANRITLYYSPITNQIAVIIKQSAITSYQEYYSALSNLDYHKIAIRYKDNDFSFWINGVQVGTGLSGIVPSGLKQLAFNYGDNLNFPFYGKTKMVGVFPYLSNDEMECLTGEGYGSFQAMALANNYTIIQG